MTAAGLDRPPTQAAPAPALVLTAIAAVRVAWLYLISRRVPAATSLLTAISAMLWAGPAAQLKPRRVGVLHGLIVGDDC